MGSIFKNIITGDIGTLYEIGYDFTLDGYRNTKGATAHPKDLTKTEIEEQGWIIVKDDKEWLELEEKELTEGEWREYQTQKGGKSI